MISHLKDFLGRPGHLETDGALQEHLGRLGDPLVRPKGPHPVPLLAVKALVVLRQHPLPFKVPAEQYYVVITRLKVLLQGRARG